MQNVVQLWNFISYDGHSVIKPGIKVPFLPYIRTAINWFCFKMNRSYLGGRHASPCSVIKPLSSSSVMGIPQGFVKLTPQNRSVASEDVALKHLHVTTDEGVVVEQATPPISSTAPAGCLAFRL